MPSDSDLLLWDYFRFEIKVDRLTAGIPANPKLLEYWLGANNAPADADSDQRAMLTTRLNATDTHGVVFYRDSDGRPCYESRNMKAAFKESANILKGLLDIKSYRSKLAERVFVGPTTVPIDALIQRAERPISVMTAQGPRTSIKRFEFADNVTLAFNLKLLKDKVVLPEHLKTLLEYLQSGGIGADRSQGSGTFQLLSFTAVDPVDASPLLSA